MSQPPRDEQPADGLAAMRAARAQGSRRRPAPPLPLHPRADLVAGARTDVSPVPALVQVPPPVPAPVPESVATATAQPSPGQQPPVAAAGTPVAELAPLPSSYPAEAARSTVSGDLEGKAASYAALAWAASARKLDRRSGRLLELVRAAQVAGVPRQVLAAVLADAEHRGGRALPDEVWRAAGLTAERE